MKKSFVYVLLAILLIASSCSQPIIDLPRGKATPQIDAAFDQFITAVNATLSDTIENNRLDIHSIMIIQDGKVVKEKWMSDGAPDKPHVLHSVSKTFTATAVGLAIAEGKLNLDDPVIQFFPEDLPDTLSDNLKAMTVKDLLTMTCGHDTEPRNSAETRDIPWTKTFLSHPVVHKPGSFFWYNTMGTYMLSAIVQKVTGEKIVDYLTPRLFEPLHINKPVWDESPQGINCGGYGLYLTTEDLAKTGQLFLQQGQWNGKQLIPKEWIEEASSWQVPSLPAGVRPESLAERGLTEQNCDWLQGYGYQVWRNRVGGYRADGARGQYIIIFPDKNAVLAVTANVSNLQAELDALWKYIYPAL